MLQRNHLVQMVDTVFQDEYGNRIPSVELVELESMLNVNLHSGDEGDAWFDEEIPVAHITEITEQEFFERYFPEHC